jgi:hypothetical protein
MNESHRINVRDKPGFLHRLMLELGEKSIMSLEGDLSRCRFSPDLVLGHDETTTLKRNTIDPRQDFVVLRLCPEMVAPVFKQVLAAGLKRAIIHVQIERNGVLELGAYDNFCFVTTGPGISADLLNEFKAKHIVRDFQVASQD